MQERERVWDAIVVGAGAAGLVASIYLAQAGLQVLVLEKAAHPGGRAISTESHGARLNLGPHALYEAALSLLREVGVKPSGGTPRLSGKLIIDSGAETLEAVDTYGLLLGRKLAWLEKTEFIRFISRLRRLDTNALEGVTLQSYLNGAIRYPQVRKLIAMLARVSTYCDAPDLLSAGAALLQMQGTKITYADGGWQSIVDELRSRAEQAGAVLRTAAPVRRIEGCAPDMSVLLGGGERIEAGAILCTAGPRQLLELLGKLAPEVYAARLEKLVPVYAACLDLVLEGVPRPRTYLAFGVERPWYYSNHSGAAKLTGHPGHAVIHAAKYLRPGTSTLTSEDEAELERFLDILQPGWRDHIVMQRFLPRMLVSHGAVTAAEGGLRGRPDTSVPGIPGLYTAGDWVGSEGMLLNASLASAKEAAGRIISAAQDRSRNAG